METNGAVKRSHVQRSEADWRAVLARDDQSGQTRRLDVSGQPAES